MRTTLRQAEAALTEGNAQDAQTLYQQAASLLDKAAQKGVIKKGMANRKKSRLARKLNQIEAT
jgi:small subunit ribosomal protein S20